MNLGTVDIERLLQYGQSQWAANERAATIQVDQYLEGAVVVLSGLLPPESTTAITTSISRFMGGRNLDVNDPTRGYQLFSSNIYSPENVPDIVRAYLEAMPDECVTFPAALGINIYGEPLQKPFSEIGVTPPVTFIDQQELMFRHLAYSGLHLDGPISVPDDEAPTSVLVRGEGALVIGRQEYDLAQLSRDINQGNDTGYEIIPTHDGDWLMLLGQVYPHFAIGSADGTRQSVVAGHL